MWAPTLHLPWSGAVAQQIDPDISWFFKGINPAAGRGDIEEQAFALASYGKQLGLLTQVLLDLAQQTAPSTPQARDALEQLQWIAQGIERIKQQAGFPVVNVINSTPRIQP